MREYAIKTKNRSKRVWLARTAIYAAWVSAILWVATSSLDSPLRPSRRAQVRMLTVMPQGWAFFTRDPRLPLLIVFERVDGRFHPAVEINASRGNYFGLKRISRRFDLEIAAIMAQVPDTAWFSTRSKIAEFEAVANRQRSFSVPNRAPRPRVCGEYALVRRPPTPWAWAHLEDTIRHPVTLVRLAIVCD